MINKYGMKYSNLYLLIFIFISACSGDNNNSVQQVVSQNSVPTISGSIEEIRVGEVLDFMPISNDNDNDILIFSITGMPEWASFNSSSGLLTGVPLSENLNEVYFINISVSDGLSNASTGTFNLTVTEPVFFISIGIDSMDFYRNMDIELSGCIILNGNDSCTEADELLTINDNGIFVFQNGIKTGASYKLKVDRNPGRQDCALSVENGVMASEDQVVSVSCFPDESAELFRLDKMHKIRISISVDEWRTFLLDTERANYRTGNANNIITEWNSLSHSEIYRQVDFEYLDSAGETIEILEKVGFKMKGNTSRQWPEEFYKNDGEFDNRPKRFSFSLKFDEKFDDDESVYSCIDNSGSPSSVKGHPCWSRIGKNLDEVPENDDRTFMGLEKIFLRYNRDDPSYQRELLAHDIFNSIGIPLSRASHANVELLIEGEGDLYNKPLPRSYNMGVFQILEQIDKPFLKRFFGKNGFLFKMSDNADLAGSEEIDPNCIFYEDSITYIDSNFCQIGVEKTDPISRQEWLGSSNYLNPQFVNSDINDGGEESQFRPYKPPYDLKTKKKSITDGRELLTDFIAFVQTYPSSEMLREHFDIDIFIKAQAAEIVIGAVDHYVRVGNNYYLYFNPITEKWIYIPNDFDFVFRDSHELSIGRPLPLEAFRDIAETYAFPNQDKVDWKSRELGSVEPILWNIIFSEQANKDLLYKNIKFILENNLQWEEVSEKLYKRNNLVKNAIEKTEAALPEGGCNVIYNPAAIDAEAGTQMCDEADISIKRFIETRINALMQELSIYGH